jgi:hypothetical protein
VGTLIVAAIVPMFLLHIWLDVFRHARERYPQPFFRHLILVVTLVIIALAAGYTVLAAWALRWLWSLFWTVASKTPEVSFAPVSVPIYISIPLLAVAAYASFVLLKPVPRKHRCIWRLLGRECALKGYLKMAVLRLRQPRRDFFAQAPLIRDIPFLALAAVLYEASEAWMFSGVLSLLVIVTSIGLGIDLLLPPAWMFLGTSQFASFDTFDVLRSRWFPVFGLTLLDRDSPDWNDYYFAQARRMARRQFGARLFMNKPQTARVWSLRSRGELWVSTVHILMDVVMVIVIDARVKSDYVSDEQRMLIELGLVEKAWLIAEQNGSAPAVDEALDWAEKNGFVLPTGARERLLQRVVTEKELYASGWTKAGLHIGITHGP